MPVFFSNFFFFSQVVSAMCGSALSYQHKLGLFFIPASTFAVTVVVVVVVVAVVVCFSTLIK